MCGFQTAVVNLEADQRFKTDEILLPVTASASAYKKHGLARVLCGVDSSGVQHDEPNYAADMRELDVGIWCDIPDDDRGEGTIRVRVRAWDMLLAADGLGANSALPYSESPGAHRFCRSCTANQSGESKDCYRPFSFLRKQPVDQCSPCLLNFEHIKAKLDELRGTTSATRVKEIFKEEGFNKIVYAFNPIYIPHIDPTNVAPVDGLHLGPDGLLRHEGAWLFYILCKLGLDLEVVNDATRSYTGFPADVRIPSLPAKLKEGRAGNLPKRNHMLKMSGSQVMHFAFHR